MLNTSYVGFANNGHTNIYYGNGMTHKKTWNLSGSSAYKLLIP